MIRFSLFFFLFASATQAAPILRSANNSLEVKIEDDKVSVELPKKAYETLMKWNPEFVVFSKTDYSASILELFKTMGPNQLPMAFIDDIDGNNKKDIVLLGSDIHNQYVIALLQENKTWKLVKVTEWSMRNIKDSVITTFSASGTNNTKETGIPIYILPALGEHAVKLKEKKKKGIQVENYLGPADVYEIKNNKAVKFTL